MRNHEFWKNASNAERAKLRKVVAAHDNIGERLMILVYPLIFGVIFAPMATVMLMQHHKLGTYTETVCNGTQDIHYSWCKLLKPPCSRAYTVTTAGQKVTLNFPSYSRHLEQWRSGDYNQWLKTVRSTTFPCFVENSSKSTKGVIYTTLTGLYGWWFMAGLAGLLLGFAFCNIVAAGVYWIEYLVRTSRLEPHLAEFINNVIVLNYYRKSEYLDHYEQLRTESIINEGIRQQQRQRSASETERAVELALQDVAAEWAARAADPAAQQRTEHNYWIVDVDSLAVSQPSAQPSAQPNSGNTTPDFETEPPSYEKIGAMCSA